MKTKGINKKLTKTIILNMLKNLGLPTSEFWIDTGAACVLHGAVEDTRDIDIGITEKLFNSLRNSHEVFESESGAPVIHYRSNPSVDLYLVSQPEHLQITHGYQIVRLVDLQRYYFHRRLKKDLIKLRKISEYLRHNGMYSAVDAKYKKTNSVDIGKVMAVGMVLLAGVSNWNYDRWLSKRTNYTSGQKKVLRAARGALTGISAAISASTLWGTNMVVDIKNWTFTPNYHEYVDAYPESATVTEIEPCERFEEHFTCRLKCDNGKYLHFVTSANEMVHVGSKVNVIYDRSNDSVIDIVPLDDTDDTESEPSLNSQWDALGKKISKLESDATSTDSDTIKAHRLSKLSEQLHDMSVVIAERQEKIEGELHQLYNGSDAGDGDDHSTSTTRKTPFDSVICRS